MSEINRMLLQGSTVIMSLVQSTNSTSVALVELGRAAERARHRIDPLLAMGFDDDERGQIINLCSAAGWNPVQFGQMVMALRPVPQLDWKELFIFSWHWRIVARQAFWLALALVLTAVMG